MSNFNEKANKIMASLLQEGVEEESKVVKVKTPTGLCDVKVKCINTSSGCSYIADESIDCVNKGDDVTEMVSEDEEETHYSYEEDEEDSVEHKHEYIRNNKDSVQQYVDNYVSNALDSGRAEEDGIDEEDLEHNALDYLMGLSLEELKKELSLFTGNEEDEEDADLKKLGLDDNALGAVAVATKLSTKASGGMNPFSRDPQKAMNTAYGDLMKKIAGKITKISTSIK
jgi:hypothetical protein